MMKKRTTWMLKHPVQSKYLLIVIFAMLTPTLLLGFCLYHLVFYLLANQLAFPEAISANLTPVVRQVNMLMVLILPVLMLTFLSLAVIISHRFGGPIERLEADLDRILGGEHNHRIRMRPGDDLKGVGARINLLIDTLKKKR